MDNKMVTLLVSLDLSAAFDTIDHDVLIQRCFTIGITDEALKWIKGYLSNRSQYVSICDQSSSKKQLSFGVPQGSVLGPLLFTIYMRELGILIRRMGIDCQFYADDTTIFLSSHVSELKSQLVRLEDCLLAVSSWCTANFLQLNSAKSEFMLVGSKTILGKCHDITEISINNQKVTRSACIRLLGVTLDQHLNMDLFVSKTCSSAFAYLRTLSNLRPCLDKESLAKLMHAFVISRLDYCLILLAGTPQSTQNRLQRALNAAVRMLCGLQRSDHVSHAYKSLEWLQLQQRIMLRVALLVFKTIHFSQPADIALLIQPYVPNRSLRSSSHGLLEVPPTNTSFGDRAFGVFGPKLWNKLPFCVRGTNSIGSFKHYLEMYLLNND
jgi:hypothetical protein